MFIQMLEGLHHPEIELVCLVKDKSLTNKYKISKQVVEKAFPDIRWGSQLKITILHEDCDKELA